jgi:hypothetical protein
MKKLLVLVCAVIVVAACAAPPPSREATPPATTAASPTASPMTEADAIAKEKAIWDAIKAKDYDAFAAMIAEDSVEVVPEGVMDKAGSITGVKQFEPSEVNFSNWKFLSIDRDAYIVVYDVATKGKFAGKDFPLQTAHASSAWVSRGGKWLAIYHQECAARTAPATPPRKTATPPAAASPAAAEAPPATGSDPIANERMVWDLFKAKKYDAFAELIPSDFIEVEPEGVLDRAGTIEGVKMFDASKAVLSDLKAVNIDEDAALVTYTVTNPAPGFDPAGNRHTTIWVRRTGKWMGLLHHGGTPVRKPAPTPSPSVAKSPAASPSAAKAPAASPSVAKTP